MVRRAKLSMIAFKHLWRFGLLWFIHFQLDCLWPGDGVPRLTVGHNMSVRKGSTVQTLRDCSGLVWSPRTRSPRWRCQQMALGNTQSSPRVAEAGEKLVPCKWVPLCSTFYKLLLKHIQKTEKQVSFHTAFFYREREIFNFKAVRIKTLLQPG